VPYHVEVRRSRNHARVFNLSEQELVRTVVEPWRHGRPLELGDRRWERRGSALRILHGPALEGVDLAYGQGWNNAERSARDVTEEMLGGTAIVAVLSCTQQGADAATALLDRLGLQAIDWRAAARAPILRWLLDAGSAAEIDFAAALVIGAETVPEWWLFEAGIALGALGPRALLLQLDGGPPPAPLRELDVLHIAPRDDDGVERLRARLRRAGCALPAVAGGGDS
jgi:hypothetical protein